MFNTSHSKIVELINFYSDPIFPGELRGAAVALHGESDMMPR